jgi:hypothetical protein
MESLLTTKGGQIGRLFFIGSPPIARGPFAPAGDRSSPGWLWHGWQLRRAVKWVSGNLQEDPGQPVQPLVQQAIFKFDLSPRGSRG